MRYGELMREHSIVQPFALGLLVATVGLACGGSVVGGGSTDAGGGDAGGGDAADSSASVFVRGIAALTPPTCIASAASDSPLLTSGLLDLGFSNTYAASLLVGSRLPPLASSTSRGPDPNEFTVGDVNITLRDSTGSVVATFDVTPSTAAVVTPAVSGAPSFSIVGLTLIPATAIQSSSFGTLLSAAGPTEKVTLHATVSVSGGTFGGQMLSAPDFTFDVQTCYGCSVSFAKAGAPASASSGLPTPTCFGNQSSVGNLDTDFCALGQDLPMGVPCGDCQGTAACTLCKVDADCTASGVTNAHCSTMAGVCTPN